MTTPDPVAIQGEEGSNSAVAARSLLGADVQLLPCVSFREAFARLDSGEVRRAVLPVENTTAGLIQEVWDRLLGVGDGPPLTALAEARVRIGFVAACLPGARVRVRRVLAHPVAAAQCSRFLTQAGLEVVPCHDTAGAARLVRERSDEEVCALCPKSAAAFYGLEVLSEDCGDARHTVTRFLLVEHGDARPAPDDDHSLLTLVVADAPGALVRALLVFSSHDLNLTALHSRAIPGRPGRYAFLLEIEAGALAPAFEAAVEELRAQGAEARVLGSYQVPPWPAAP